MIVLRYFARIILYPFSSPRIEGNLRLARIDTRPHLVATSCGHSSRVTADFVGGTANHPTDENRWRGLRKNRKSVAWASQKLKECCVGLRGISLLRKWPAWDFLLAEGPTWQALGAASVHRGDAWQGHLDRKAACRGRGPGVAAAGTWRGGACPVKEGKVMA